MNKERIRLLITDDSLPLGGKETLLLQQLEHLDRDTFEVHLVTQTDKGELLPQARERADHYFCLHRRCGLDLSAIHRLRRYMVDHFIDIVHTNAWIDTLYVYLASRGLKIKKISTIHGYSYGWRRLVNLWLPRYFDRIICVSKSLKLDLFKFGLPLEKMIVVYNSYDSKRFKKDISEYQSKEANPFRIVMVGNFTWAKDQMTLLKAIHIVRQQRNNVELHLVGGGDSYRIKAAQSFVAKHDLDKVVKFWGQKRVDANFLLQFDLFAFSSKCETFGISVLEAMACGLPVLVSDIPPSIELIQHGKCGLYFETGNAQRCAEVIVRLIKDPDLRRSMGKKAQLRAQDFRPEIIIRDLEQVYREVLEVA